MPDNYASRIARQRAGISNVTTKLGTLVARIGNEVLVNVGDGAVLLPFRAQELPPAGHAVRIQTADGKVEVTGAASALPPRATVTAIGDPLITVTAYETTYDLLAQTSYLPQVGDLVELIWSIDGGLIRGEIASPEVVAPPVANPGGGGGAFHPAPFTAIDTASWQSGYGWSKSDVWASDSLTGAAFYGSKVADTIPNDATITLARIYLSPTQTSGSAPILRVHTSPTRPGGNVTFIGSGYALPARSGWQGIPGPMIDYLKANGGGIGIDHGGFSRFRGVSQDALAFALDIAWTTP